MNISNELQEFNLEAFQSTEKNISEYKKVDFIKILNSWVNAEYEVNIEKSFPFLLKCRNREFVQNRLILYLIRLCSYCFTSDNNIDIIIIVRILTRHIKEIEDISDYNPKLLSDILK